MAAAASHVYHHEHSLRRCCVGQHSSSRSSSSRFLRPGWHHPHRRPSTSSGQLPAADRCAVVANSLFRQHKSQQQQQQLVAVDGPTSAPQQCQGWTAAAPIALTSALCFGAAYWFKVQAEAGKRSAAGGAGSARRAPPEQWPEIPRPDADPRAYRMALARTRQALNVQRAVSFMKAGEPSRAMVELHRALDENAVCRSPLLDGHQTKAELRDLYKLHLLQSPAPHSFATLLQLRELLGIAPAEGEEIEVAVLETGTAFSI